MAETKIIKAVFGGMRSVITQPRMQYDYGQVIEVSGITLPESFEARFSNAPTGESVRVLGQNQRVSVPDDLLRRTGYVYCYITVHDALTDGRTMYTAKIPIKPATERTDAEPTPVQQDIITQAIATLNSAVDTTTQKAQEASKSAGRAETARDTAEGYVDDVQEYAQQAQTSANSASASATESANSASQAKSAETGAMEAEASAWQYSQNASAKASDAIRAASNAIQSAETASTSAQEASAKASEASQSASDAQQAQNLAESAKTASQTAKEDAWLARDEAWMATDEAVSAKNEAQESARIAAQKADSITGLTATAETLEPDASATASYKDGVLTLGIPKGEKGDKGDKGDTPEITLENVSFLLPTDTASGSIASFPDGADNIPMESLKVKIEPVQDLSKGDPSPDNICPISGWEEVKVSHSGADTSNPSTITIPLGQTVYGGTLDVVKGELVVDRAMVDLGTLNFQYDNSVFYASMTNYSPKPKYQGLLLSPIYVNRQVPLTNPPNFSVFMSNSAKIPILRVTDSRYTTAADLKTAMSGVPLVYELAEPITIPLSPTEIRSLLGDNNVWGDTGDTEVVYRADIQRYIEKKLG